MKGLRKIVIGGIIISGLIGFLGCDKKENQQRPAESKGEYFLDRGVMGKPDAFAAQSGIGVALGDVDGDGDLDLISASPNGIKYFENLGNGKYLDRGVIGKTDAFAVESGIGVALGDIDGDGDLDLISASPNGIKYFENTIPQKNKK